MKNIIKNLGIIALTAIIIFSMAGCSVDNDNDNDNGNGGTPTYTVTFNADGGTPEPPKQTVVKGGKVAEPPAMTKADFAFDGWYKEAAFTNVWDFAADTVTANITLYAKWIPVYTVTFNADDGTPAPEPQKVPHGRKATEPDPLPTKAGMVIEGWYKEAAFTTKWDFDTDTVTAEITLYANWVLGHTVTFNPKNGTAPFTQAVVQDRKATKPADPTKTITALTAGTWRGPLPTSFPHNITFLGWFHPEGGEYDFDTVPSSDFSLVAKWDDIYTSFDDPDLLELFDTMGITNIPYGIVALGLNEAYVSFTLILDRDVTFEVSTVIPSSININQNDVTVTIRSIDNTVRTISKGTAANGTLFTVGGADAANQKSAKLIIDGSITLQGKTDNNNAVVFVRQGGTFEMKGNTKITGNTRANTAGTVGGVRVGTNGNFIMSGGSIMGNTSDQGGGIYVEAGSFTMLGGVISGNTANGVGGGVRTASTSGTMRIVSGTIYGSDAASGLANISNSTSNPNGAAFYKLGPAERGTFSVPGDVTSTWTSAGSIDTTNNTINIVNGAVVVLP